jgi:hypothetical protein
MSRVADLRRLRLRAGSSVDEQLRALEMAKSSGVTSHILQKATRLQGQSRARKRTSAMRRHKADWAKESRKLAAEVRTLERELRELPIVGALSLSELPRTGDPRVDQRAQEEEGEIWQDYRECAVLVKAVGGGSKMGGAQMREDAAERIGDLKQRLCTGLRALEEEERQLLSGSSSAEQQHGDDGTAEPQQPPQQRASRDATDGQSADGLSMEPLTPLPLPAAGPPRSSDGERAGVAAASEMTMGMTEGGATEAEAASRSLLRQSVSVLQAHDDGGTDSSAGGEGGGGGGGAARRLRALDARYLGELERLQRDFEAKLPSGLLSLPRNGGGGGGGGEASAAAEVEQSGGWEPRAAAVFEKVAREFARRGGREGPDSRPRYLARLGLELPEKSAAEIAEHDRCAHAVGMAPTN